MKSFLEAVVNTPVRIEQFGDTGVNGILVNVRSDYASLLNDKKQLIHYPYGHIKSARITITETPRTVATPEIPLPETFSEVLESLLTQYVQIENGEGSQKGVLSSIRDDVASVIVNTKDLIYYPVSQIKNVSPIYIIKSVESESNPTDPNSTTSVSSAQRDSGTEQEQEQVQDDTKSKVSTKQEQAGGETKSTISAKQEQEQAHGETKSTGSENLTGKKSGGSQSDAQRGRDRDVRSKDKDSRGKEKDARSEGRRFTCISSVTTSASVPSYLNDACKLKARMKCCVYSRAI